MGCPDRRQFAVDLDQPDQKGCRFQGTAAVRGMGKLVQVVPYPRKLPQQVGCHPWGFPALPQAQTSRDERTSSESVTPLFSAISCQCRFSSAVVRISIRMCRAFFRGAGAEPPLGFGASPIRHRRSGGIEGGRSTPHEREAGHFVSGREYAREVS